MTETISEFAPKRQLPQSLDEIEDTITKHRRATEQSTVRLNDVPERRAGLELNEIAQMVASLPLRQAMEMAEAVVKLEEYKPPTTKIELAMLLNEWAEKRLASVYGAREG
jgi:hypothetical protein